MLFFFFSRKNSLLFYSPFSLWTWWLYIEKLNHYSRYVSQSNNAGGVAQSESTSGRTSSPVPLKRSQWGVEGGRLFLVSNKYTEKSAIHFLFKSRKTNWLVIFNQKDMKREKVFIGILNYLTKRRRATLSVFQHKNRHTSQFTRKCLEEEDILLIGRQMFCFVSICRWIGRCIF